MAQHRGQMKRRLADTDDRRRRDATRRFEAGVIETGNDVGGNPVASPFAISARSPGTENAAS
jgi:hypothetical protein